MVQPVSWFCLACIGSLRIGESPAPSPSVDHISLSFQEFPETSFVDQLTVSGHHPSGFDYFCRSKFVACKRKSLCWCMCRYCNRSRRYHLRCRDQLLWTKEEKDFARRLFSYQIHWTSILSNTKILQHAATNPKKAAKKKSFMIQMTAMKSSQAETLSTTNFLYCD